jgi:hypothetical protein
VLDHRHAAPEAAVRLRQFEADIATAEEETSLRLPPWSGPSIAMVTAGLPASCPCAMTTRHRIGARSLPRKPGRFRAMQRAKQLVEAPGIRKHTGALARPPPRSLVRN